MVTDCLKQSCWEFLFFLVCWSPQVSGNGTDFAFWKSDLTVRQRGFFLLPFPCCRLFRENMENVNWFLVCFIRSLWWPAQLGAASLALEGCAWGSTKSEWHQHPVWTETQQGTCWPCALKGNSAVPAVPQPWRKAVCLCCCHGLNERSLNCLENVPVNSFSFVYLSVYILVAVVLCTNTN